MKIYIYIIFFFLGGGGGVSLQMSLIYMFCTTQTHYMRPFTHYHILQDFTRKAFTWTLKMNLIAYLSVNHKDGDFRAELAFRDSMELERSPLMLTAY